MSDLRKGYTTGVHATFAFKSAIEAFLYTKKLSIATSKKMENDDLDVTKGCEIVVTVSDKKEDLELNHLSHKPYNIEDKLFLYAGRGVGVVTKDGLKPPKGYPAVNPTPLNAIKEIVKSYEITKPIFVSISVTNGEQIAKQTANEKVGVIGGISILGSSGFVKPISSDAYLKSVEVELEVIKKSGYEKVIFTLGNSSLQKALQNYPKEQIVEIGNFIYDGFDLAFAKDLEVKIYLGVGKAVKIAQGFKNTHNRFGSIDFKMIEKWVGIDLDGVVTVKRVCEIVDKKEFYKLVKDKVKQKVFEWFKKDIEVEIC